jgi:hypothetical protein
VVPGHVIARAGELREFSLDSIERGERRVLADGKVLEVAKLDGEERINRALPDISEYCLNLVDAHRASDNAYPLAA